MNINVILLAFISLVSCQNSNPKDKLLSHPNGETENIFQERLGINEIEAIFKKYIYTDNWKSIDGTNLSAEIDSLFKDYVDSCFIASVDINLLTLDLTPEQDTTLYIEFAKEKFRIETTQDYIGSLNDYQGFWISMGYEYRYEAEELLMLKYYNLVLSLLEPEDRKLLEADQKLWKQSFESSKGISELITETKYGNRGGREDLYDMRPNMLERAEYLFIWYKHLKEGRDNIDKTVYVRYTTPIRGYNFHIAYEKSAGNNMLNGRLTILSLQNDTIYDSNRYCGDLDNIEFDSLSNGEVIHLDYKAIKESSSEFIAINSRHDPCSEFSFLDVNFDGKDELIICNASTGQRNRYTYTVLTFPECEWLIGDGEQIDSGWMIDAKNKRLVSDITGGDASNTYQIWEWNESKDDLILLKEVEEMGYMEEETILTVHNFYNGTEIAKRDSMVINSGETLNKDVLYRGLSL
ncbi:hypothetical protein M2101_000722 [Parabacteroides sp. PM5-20]|uniref:hypothetical protein n=2 Tax=unclassified Parabacteroides TaxID=2649774 RepID=UPI0024746A95|nr:hypothetical protein [Parabacteroides sp. PM5-20]MDH6534064.1 hypothetical protein [Parabacteroides sp. PM5-20]